MQAPTPISEAEIHHQLAKILSFPLFKNSVILSRFLTFIVEETLEGREKTLKEYTIGTNVLSKKTGYDPQSDASVRIHAGRLRRGLYDYYYGPGSHDPILITVPKGSYVPQFDWVEPSGPKDMPDQIRRYYKPTLAVLPFHLNTDPSLYSLADGLCDQISTELTNFSEFSMISYFSSRKIVSEVSDMKELALMLDAQYLLTGSIQSDLRSIRIRVQLIQPDTHHQIWAHTYEKDRESINTFSIQDDIVRHVVNQIAGSHGIIFREAAKSTHHKLPVDIKVYDAVFWFYRLVNDLNEEAFQQGLAAMKEAVTLDPNYALGWAILGETYVAGNFFGFTTDTPHPLEEAVKCGMRALKIEPRCQHAYQTLSMAYLFLHQPKKLVETIDQWQRMHLNSASIAGALGFCLICVGEMDRGFSMLSDSIQLNPYYPWWYNAGLSFYFFHRKEYSEALYWADKMQRQSVIWEMILKSAAYSGMNRVKEAQESLLELKKSLPEFPLRIMPVLNTFLQVDELINRLYANLEKAEVTYYR
jgi:TolB-like protein